MNKSLARSSPPTALRRVTILSAILRPRNVLAVLTALMVVAALFLATGTASAATGPEAETRAGASTSAAQALDRPPQSVSADQRLGNTLPQGESAVATGVAANTASRAGATVNMVETYASKPLKPQDAVARWDEFLGPGAQTNIHPRTGLPDADRLVSSDGLRSIRFGNHEMGSSPTKFHFHEETWSFDDGAGAWNLQNIVVRVPFPKGAW